jgi:hypothetical protein
VRYPIPIAGGGSGYDLAQDDSLLRGLWLRDSSVFYGETYPTAEPKTLRDEDLDYCFKKFTAWATASTPSLRSWTTLHHSSWNINRHLATFGGWPGHMFNLDKLVRNPELDKLSRQTQLEPHDLCHAFDCVLKYPLLGKLAGMKGHFLYHWLRRAFSLPTECEEIGTPPDFDFAVEFKDDIKQIATRCSMDEYTSLLHELRGAVREAGLREVRRGDVDAETIREIASRARLSPRLRDLARAAGIVRGIVAGLGFVPELGKAAKVAGVVLSVGQWLWDGYLPRGAARIRWLQWFLEWDAEKYARQRV